MGIFSDKGRTAPQQQPATNTPAQTAGPRPPMFGGFGGTASRSRGTFINPGTYLLEVKKTQGVVSSKPDTKGHEKFVAEFLVKHVIAPFPQEMSGATVRFEASNRKGEKVAYIQNVTANPEIALGAIKGLFLAIAQSEQPGFEESDASPEEWDEVIAEAIAPPGTKCEGTLVVCHASKHQTVKGRWITVCSFGPYNPESAEQTTPATASASGLAARAQGRPPAMPGQAPPDDDIPF